MTRTVARWFIVLVGGTLVVLSLFIVLSSRTAVVRERLVETLGARLDSEVELGSLQVSTFPTLTIRGERLVLRHQRRTDVPPLIAIERFSVDGGLIGLISRARRVRTVRLEGLKIHIPPGGLDEDDIGNPDEMATGDSRVIIDRIESSGAELILVPKRAGKEPRVFRIHELALESVGFDRPMAFRAALTNPKPEGRIDTTGSFGPWQPEEPARTPVKGTYTFRNVDLATIEGIAGRLSSIGRFEGHLGKIDVHGETDTPDFRIDIGQPVPLKTRFHATVDGTDGDTYLRSVDAKLLETSLVTKGAIVGRPGEKGRAVVLDVTIEQGRIEDLLRLAMKSKQPFLRGAVTLRTKLDLPPGRQPVVDKLGLQGQFGIVEGRFTDPEVQAKLADMSRRARGVQGPAQHVAGASKLGGRFRLERAVMEFADLSFSIPGADVNLSGNYGLRSEQIDFQGSLRMQATLSQAAGGRAKGVLLKVVDPFFRKEGAGAVLPIKVGGTREKPQFGLDVVRALTPK